MSKAERPEHLTYTIDEICARFGVTASQWQRWADRGLVPQANFVWRDRPRWLRAVIDEWEASGGDLFASDQRAFELDAKNPEFTEIAKS